MDDHQGHIELQGQLVDRDSWSAAACSMDRAVKGSNLLLLREAFYGSTRFDEFVRRTGLSEPVVASELRHLVDAGLFVRVPYQELGERERLEYRLTEMGRELITSVVALMEWGDRWLAPDGPPGTRCRWPRWRHGRGVVPVQSRMAGRWTEADAPTASYGSDGSTAGAPLSLPAVPTDRRGAGRRNPLSMTLTDLWGKRLVAWAMAGLSSLT